MKNKSRQSRIWFVKALKVILGFETSAMTNLEQRFSEDLMITQSSKSVRDPIPVDLLIDILSRVPAKSIARFRCVSKFWESILRRPDFTDLFLTKSVARPRLFFALEVNKELFVFSSPQPQNPDENSSLVATRYKAFPKRFPTRISPPLYGLVFLQTWRRNARVICNPVTGESLTLPKVKATAIKQSHFGFDPINKQFKVLYMTWSRYGTPNTHRVLTLETGKRLWRTIQDPLPPHFTYCDGICINGVLYYQAFFEGSSKIVCFDFRFERFSLINMDKDMLHNQHVTLFDYKGKLGANQYTSFWVLEDAGNHKWSKRIYVQPSLIEKNMFVGMTGTGELVFSPYAGYLPNPFHIFCYNIEKNTFTRVNIQGFEEFKHQCIIVHTFLDYVENMKFI